jgi:hypothetical protein
MCGLNAFARTSSRATRGPVDLAYATHGPVDHACATRSPVNFSRAMCGLVDECSSLR